ncbi:MAG: type I DNA topoisomerase [Candidatus Peribacteraceae bacterium]|nr:type I DNA topoisomerase [Candidatus Peribacteraceae bacterium]
MPKHLVIVESPTKAKTIKRFLGKDYDVQSSMGHIRDLPTSEIGIDTEHDYEPTYVIPKEKMTTVKNLKAAYKEADDLYLATDEDREGEAIGWHLLQALKVPKPATVKRIVFHEITEEAIKAAIANPRTIDQKLVDAQQARRVLDRLVGYTLSPFLWKKVYRGLSAGRVQSVVVRLIVDRERLIKAFKAEEYWTIAADLKKETGEDFTADLKAKNGEAFVPKNKEEADQVLADTKDGAFAVEKMETKELTKTPPPPFTTSTLQQEAARKLGFSVKQTMVVAQQLYEGMSLGKGAGTTGLITYMRTDSVHLSEKAVADATATISKLYGKEYTLTSPRQYKTKSKGAQEAHEAIRPTEVSRTPQSVADVLDDQQLKLYTLIWNRTMATQMAPAEIKRVGANIAVSGNGTTYTFRATGQTILFDGFLRVYFEDKDEEQMEKEKAAGEHEGEKFLPSLEEGEKLTCDEITPEQHFTKPPPRYTEASLVKKLEEEGIGRPSTYAPTISTVQQRGYILKENKQLIPQDIAFTVTDLLSEHFKDIVDLKFTAKMEGRLDDIAEGKEEWVPFMRGFFEPFSALVASKTKEIKKEDVMKDRELGKDPETGLPIVVRTGRFGAYVQLGLWDKEKGKKAKPKAVSLLKTMKTDTVTLEEAINLLSFPKQLGKNDQGEPVELHLGRFGPYVKAGTTSASLPKTMHPFDVDFTVALQLIADRHAKVNAAPLATLGTDPVSKGQILVKDGRYGPYVTDGTTNASLSKKIEPAMLTLDQAVEILAKKRAAGPGKRPFRKFKRAE